MPVIRGLVDGEAAALAGRSLPALTGGALAAALESSPSGVLRLARYEQLSGRERPAHDRLTAVLPTVADPSLRRDLEVQLQLGVAFEPAFGAFTLSLDGPPGVVESSATAVRALVAVAFDRLVMDGIEPAGGWTAAPSVADWAEQLSLEERARLGLLELLARDDPAEILDAIDLLYWVPTLSLAHSLVVEGLQVADAARRAAERAGLGAIGPFLDHITGCCYTTQLRVAEAADMVDRALAGFEESGNWSWWMHVRSIQHVLAVMSREQPPGGGTSSSELERLLLMGDWRDGRRSLGHSVLMELAIVLTSLGDADGARRIILADGDIDDLVLTNPDRALTAEMLCAAAVADGDTVEAARLQRIVDHMMPSPYVLIVRERMQALLSGTAVQEAPVVEDLGHGFEVFRTRWLLLSDAVRRGRRDAALGALANLDAYATEARIAAVRTRAVQLFRAPVAPADGVLSTRQLEVATLAAAGRTNREIAAALFLGVRTVEGYVASALRALGLARREDLATVSLPVSLGAASEVAEPVYLTLRQGQVAALIAAGASNLDIADTLGITEKTVDKHIAAIKDRTGLGTRTAIAASFHTVLARAALPAEVRGPVRADG
ncbi:LuxR family transcriptional regulator [Jiangella rhizosphaerae]|uniref:LuxR family transcriptional regulator n=1 Tax=Jiangella rhizosphaerae TaxID=2293569 RepID=UPI0011C45EDC|nr:LuxR family transcriptional regulator [Jiangella rhizosphaerae]